MSEIKQKLISQPTDWLEAWEKAAKEAEVSLSRWIGEQCNKALPKQVRKGLSETPLRGRPTKAE